MPIFIIRSIWSLIAALFIVMSLFTVGMAGTSTGNYLSVSEPGPKKPYDGTIRHKEKFAMAGTGEKDGVPKLAARTDPESISKGETLFHANCKFCHNAYNSETLVGPGLKGVLKNPELPVSKRPATPENIRRQLRRPFSRMPSFAFLSDEEVEDIVAFLNTL
jgi:mono/diheme cytochrome c family protein